MTPIGLNYLLSLNKCIKTLISAYNSNVSCGNHPPSFTFLSIKKTSCARCLFYLSINTNVLFSSFFCWFFTTFKHLRIYGNSVTFPVVIPKVIDWKFNIVRNFFFIIPLPILLIYSNFFHNSSPFYIIYVTIFYH